MERGRKSDEAGRKWMGGFAIVQLFAMCGI